MMATRLLVLVLLVVACKGKSAPPNKVASPSASSVGGASWYLDLGALHERYQDREGAARAFAQAAAAAKTRDEKVAANFQLGRIRDALGDRDGAIGALEQALAASEVAPAAGNGPPIAIVSQAAATSQDELLARLARLYFEAGRGADADKLFAKALAATREPFARDRLLRLEVDLLQKRGALSAAITQWEKKAFAEINADEPALYALAVAWGGGTYAGTWPGMWAGEPPAAELPTKNSKALVRVYRKLAEFHPEDRAIRDHLRAAYERAGMVDEVVLLLSERPPPSAPDDRTPELAALSAQCPGGLQPLAPLDPDIARAEQLVLSLIAMKSTERARQEVAKLEQAHAKTPRKIQALIVAARLYQALELGTEADDALSRAARGGSREERRAAEYIRMQGLQRRMQHEELAALYQRWQKTDDPCLELAGLTRARDEAHPGFAAGATAPREEARR